MPPTPIVTDGTCGTKEAEYVGHVPMLDVAVVDAKRGARASARGVAGGGMSAARAAATNARLALMAPLRWLRAKVVCGMAHTAHAPAASARAVKASHAAARARASSLDRFVSISIELGERDSVAVLVDAVVVVEAKMDGRSCS